MTAQAVTAINTRGVPLQIVFFDEGSPYNMYGLGIIKGKESRKAVQEVFEFYAYTLSREDQELFMPEQVFKSQRNNIPNYPQNIKTSDMQGIGSLPEKERLLDKWKY
jgi:iron(III) transport system substrate-binding protein